MRGDGRIYQRKGSPFYWCEYWLRGKCYRESTETADELQARKYLRHRLKQVGADQIGVKKFVSPKQERLTVAELLDSLASDYRLRNKWNPRVESGMKPLREQFGTYRAIDVESDDVNAYIEGLLAQGYKPATCNRQTQLLGQAYKQAVESKKLTAMPLITRLSEVGNERQGFFETENYRAVVEHLPEYLKDFVRCGFEIGWRKGALQTLRWSDVTNDVIYLRAKNSKSRKPETVPLEGELRDIIDRCRAARVWQAVDGRSHFSEFVFHNEGQPIGDFRKAWATACCAAGVGKLICRKCDAYVDAKYKCSGCGRQWKRDDVRYVGAIFHDFRRTAARNLVDAGVDITVAKTITGHRTDSMFRRYAIVNEDQKRGALAKKQAYVAATAEKKVIVMAAR